MTLSLFPSRTASLAAILPDRALLHQYICQTCSKCSRRTQRRASMFVKAGCAGSDLLHWQANYWVVSPLALAIYDLFIGQDCSQGRAPVHWDLCLVCQAPLKQLAEYPLRPFVVLWTRRGHLSVPVIGKSCTEARNSKHTAHDPLQMCWSRIGSALKIIAACIDS